MKATIQLSILFSLLWLLSSCRYYAEWQRTLAEAHLIDERAELTKMYRECMAKYSASEARAQCEHYTQMLYTLDLRGPK
jgi:hypothetical protein